MTITCKIKFIDSARFMSRSLSSLIDYLVEGIHKDKCKNYNSDIEYMTTMAHWYLNVEVPRKIMK